MVVPGGHNVQLLCPFRDEKLPRRDKLKEMGVDKGRGDRDGKGCKEHTLKRRGEEEKEEKGEEGYIPAGQAAAKHPE